MADQGKMKGRMSLKRRSTIRDVAQAAGVSITTVSFVLNGNGRISDEVAQRVRDAIAQVGYRPNSQARAIRTGQTRTIGLVLPDLRNPFFPELADVVGNALFQAGYAMLIGYGHDEDRERESLSRFAAEGVDGICWCPFSDRDTPAEIGMSQPIVVIDRPIEGYDTVSSNYRMAGRLLADELRRCGRRRIGLVNGPDGLSISRARRAALVEAMSDDCEIVWEVHNPFSVDLEEGTRDLLITQSVDAIVCGNDAIAIGVLRILRDAGVIVPGRTIVMGFDDIPIAELVEPPLTTVRQPLQDIGDKAVELLMQRMAYPNRALERIELDVVLCRRGSTSPISSG